MIESPAVSLSMFLELQIVLLQAGFFIGNIEIKDNQRKVFVYIIGLFVKMLFEHDAPNFYYMKHTKFTLRI